MLQCGNKRSRGRGGKVRLISWNVNGLRAVLKKGFLDYFHNEKADIFCLQETKLQEGQVNLDLNEYYQYWNYAVKKGYSGTAVFTKVKPLSVIYDLGVKEYDQEGRLITLEFKSFYLVNVYTPNSGRELARLDFRVEWEDVFRNFLLELDANKPVILCGDLNVAHQEIDLKNPQSNKNNAGFTSEERNQFSKLLNSGFIDTFRYFYPDKEGAYTWWSYLTKARERNAGWRIDYFIVSERLKDALTDAKIYTHIMGSDHCPVGLELDENSL